MKNNQNKKVDPIPAVAAGSGPFNVGINNEAGNQVFPESLTLRWKTARRHWHREFIVTAG